jgi:hypothetical protein
MSSSKNVSGKKLLECLQLAFEEETEYTLDETKKFVINAFKDASKVSVTKKRVVKFDTDGVAIKKQPTKYNLYIKDEMARLTIEFPDKERKELMKLAASNWNKTKLTNAN